MSHFAKYKAAPLFLWIQKFITVQNISHTAITKMRDKDRLKELLVFIRNAKTLICEW